MPASAPVLVPLPVPVPVVVSKCADWSTATAASRRDPWMTTVRAGGCGGCGERVEEEEEEEEEEEG